MPFVTEQVWQALAQVAPESRAARARRRRRESVCIAPWPPTPKPGTTREAEADRGSLAGGDRRRSRNLRAERNVPNEAKIEPILVAAEPVAAMLRAGSRLHPEL